jgi:hypothetical protein
MKPAKNNLKVAGSKKCTQSLALLMSALLTSACSTIVFDNGPQVNTTSPSVNEGHHIGGFAQLVEFSQPKNLAKTCAGNNWRSITTEQTFLNGLLNQLTYGIYAPRTTSTQCSSEGLPVGQTYGTSTDLSVTSQTAPDRVVPSDSVAPSSTGAASVNTTPSNEPPRYRDSSSESEPERDYKSESVGCSEKHRHLFFDCD